MKIKEIHIERDFNEAYKQNVKPIYDLDLKNIDIQIED